MAILWPGTWRPSPTAAPSTCRSTAPSGCSPRTSPNPADRPGTTPSPMSAPCWRPGSPEHRSPPDTRTAGREAKGVSFAPSTVAAPQPRPRRPTPAQENTMADRHPKLSTEQKALEINLDEQKYGTIVEIGAGQEVARQFFSAGAAAGTIAKTSSAYDMQISDAIYGKT